MESATDAVYSVDIPIPRHGLGPMLNVILDAAKAYGATVSAYGAPPGAEVKQWYNRIAALSERDAARLALTFESLGARSVPEI
jgi:hypothetical protein